MQDRGSIFKDFRVKAQEGRAENPIKKIEAMAFR